MQAIPLVCQAARWTIQELLVNDKELSIYVDFNEGGTFSLYQDPIIGWMTPEPGKLGSRAKKITFKYKNPEVELLSCEGKGPMTLTAVKAAVLMTKILSVCITPDTDYPCAQPLSQSDWNFTVIGGWINMDKLRECSIDHFCNEINPLNSDFALGLEWLRENGDGLGSLVNIGDLVIVNRSSSLPTFAKVIKVGEQNLQVALKLNAKGQILAFKTVSKHSVLGHWAAKELEKSPLIKKRKV